MFAVPRNSHRPVVVLGVLLLVLVVAACGGDTEATPTQTVADEVAQRPTETPIPPTETPMPTATSVPATDTPTTPPTREPTDTPEPTETSEPTATPVPLTTTPEPTETRTAVPVTATPTAAATPTSAPTATSQPTATSAPAAGPGVGEILFTSNRESWDDCYVMNADGSNVQRLTTMGRCYDAVFTPDGSAIVYEHDDDIWKMNADGTRQVNLTDTDSKLEAFPVVSPDGRRVAYLFAWEGGFEIYLMNVDGSDPHPITARELDITPAWSPDGNQLAFASARSGSMNIWIVNQDGSGLRQVTHFGSERFIHSPVFSPDGQRIAFTTIAQGTAWEVWVVGIDGSNPHKVVGAIGNSRNNSTYIAGWKRGHFLIGGYQGNWDPYFISKTGGAPQRVISHELDDKPTDWWLP